MLREGGGAHASYGPTGGPRAMLPLLPGQRGEEGDEGRFSG